MSRTAADFSLSLVRELEQSASDKRFRAKLRRKRFVAVVNYSGLRVLWIEKSRMGTFIVKSAFSLLGAQLTTVRGIDEALHALTLQTPDVVVFSLGREDDQGGEELSDLARVRQTAQYDGPLIIIGGFVSPALRDQADQLRARITDQAEEFKSWLLWIQQQTAITRSDRYSGDQARSGAD